MSRQTKWFAVIVLVMVGIIVSLALFAKPTTAPSSPVQNSTSSIPAKAEESAPLNIHAPQEVSPTSSSTNESLTYRNEQYGFEFKYPKEIEIDNFSDEKNHLFFEFCNHISCGMNSSDADYVIVELPTVPSIDRLESYRYPNDASKFFKKIKRENISIDGNEALKVTFDQEWVWIHIIHRGMLISISARNIQDNGSDGLPYSTVISTLKFF